MHDRLKAPSVHDRLKAPSVHDRLSDRHEVSRRRRHDNDGPARGYHPHRGSRYDSGEDHSPPPGPPGPRVFSKAIRGAHFLAQFRQPANLSKYSGETNPELRLADYRLACQQAAQTMTCSSSATSPCSCQTQREPGSNTSLPCRSTTSATW